MKIAIWYHCVVSGPRIPSPDHALAVVREQMEALQKSGLADACEEFHIGVNGPVGDCLEVLNLAPSRKVVPEHHQFIGGQSELTTMRALQQSLKPGWMIFYHHIKGVTYPNHPTWDRWRKCMTRACVWNWRACVQILQSGYDTTGAHWMRNARCHIVPKGQKYWGGNFWWANSDYLMTLPPLAEDSHKNRYEAEVWIGKSPAPKFMDWVRHLPMSCPA